MKYPILRYMRREPLNFQHCCRFCSLKGKRERFFSLFKFLRFWRAIFESLALKSVYVFDILCIDGLYTPCKRLIKKYNPPPPRIIIIIILKFSVGVLSTTALPAVRTLYALFVFLRHRRHYVLVEKNTYLKFDFEECNFLDSIRMCV